VKSGPIRAQRLPGPPLPDPVKLEKPLSHRGFFHFWSAEKSACGEVVWSWRQENFLNYFKGKFSLKFAGPD
jgi:hypothetical protein